MHIVTMPNWTFRLLISWISVSVNFVPVHPRGWPKAMAPPFTLTISSSRPSSRITWMDWEAKASFSSISPMSSSSNPASFSAFGTASTGPMPMISGRTPATAKERNLARGFSPSASAFSRSINNTAAAPSLICDEFPAVTVPLTEKTGFNWERTSTFVSGLTPSSWAKVTVFSTSLLFSTVRTGTSTGTISSLNFPSRIARAAL